MSTERFSCPIPACSKKCAFSLGTDLPLLSNALGPGGPSDLPRFPPSQRALSPVRRRSRDHSRRQRRPGRGVGEENGFTSCRMWEGSGKPSPGSPPPSSFIATGSGSRTERSSPEVHSSTILSAGRRPGPYFEPHLLLADLDPAAVRKARQALTLKRDDRPDITLANLERMIHRDAH